MELRPEPGRAEGVDGQTAKKAAPRKERAATTKNASAPRKK